jgi:preprotein translocase subunit SecY
VKQLVDRLSQFITNPTIRKKLLFTAGIFLLYRFLAHIPLPAVDVAQLQLLFSGSQFLSLLNIFSGGTLANFSLVAVGISPYITASIVIQLATMVFPTLKELQKDGESGREKLDQYTRLISVPVAVFQSMSVLALLNSQGLLSQRDPLTTVVQIITLVTGALILMWLGELITLYGIGNGISMLLFAGIVSQLPQAAGQMSVIVSQDQIMTLLGFGAVFLLVIALVVFMNEAIRKVNIQHVSKKIRDKYLKDLLIFPINSHFRVTSKKVIN